MKKFPLQWFITLKKNELREIEVELTKANAAIEANELQIKEKQDFITTLKSITKGEFDSWKILMAHNSIKDCNGAIKNLENKREFLLKEKSLISQKYKNKNKEIEDLEKQRKDFEKLERKKMQKKEEAELNELSLLFNSGGDDGYE